MANWLTSFRGPGGGIGIAPYEKALRAGYTPAQIAAAIPGSGLPVGPLAVDRIQSDLADLERRARSADSYASQISGYQSQLNNYQNQLSGYQDQLRDYTSQIGTLTNQYNTALEQATTAGQERDSWMAKASDWEEQFSQKSNEYELARAEAERYREEAVGRQLAGLRGGSTTSGSGFAAQSGDTTTGRTAYQDGGDSTGLRIDKGITATDPLMARKGPVVQRIRATAQGSSGQAAALASGGSGSYYASRFG